MQTNYHDIPIVILSRDRYIPLKEQVEDLLNRKYTNIHIIDNDSTYEPLLDWFQTIKSDVNIYINTIVPNDNKSFLNLCYVGVEPFKQIISDWYIFNDNDIILDGSVPNEFVEGMIYVSEKYDIQKVGMSIKIDDIDLQYDLNKWVYDYESTYWTNGVYDENLKTELYPHPIDTTFALHKPNVSPTWNNNSLRMGTPYIVKHAPFYYDPNNLPEDEIYYLKHMNKETSNWSSKVKIK